MPTPDDRSILRDLASRYAEVSHKPIQDERRGLWRRHNSLVPTRPLIYVRAFAWREMPQSECFCHDPLYRRIEEQMRMALFRATFGDDYVIEPWVTVRARCITPEVGVWGVPHTWHGRENGGAGVWDAPIADLADLSALVEPHHAIDRQGTARDIERVNEAIGDLITVNVDRRPEYTIWNGDISTQLVYLRGLEQIMWDMMDDPAGLHRLLAFMRDGILRAQREAEEAGDWTLCNHENQAIPYALELDDPIANSAPVPRQALWVFCASQETTAVGPTQFDEFMLQYQLPIVSQFGLVAYGCCEDLTNKIDVLRQIPNLRRIAVSPMANVARCAEQIGTDYVFSYRPSPADMVGYGFDPQRVRDILTADLEACSDCHVDITLKDVETVQGDQERCQRWVEITREVIESVC